MDTLLLGLSLGVPRVNIVSLTFARRALCYTHERQQHTTERQNSIDTKLDLLEARLDGKVGQ